MGPMGDGGSLGLLPIIAKLNPLGLSVPSPIFVLLRASSVFHLYFPRLLRASSASFQTPCESRLQWHHPCTSGEEPRCHSSRGVYQWRWREHCAPCVTVMGPCCSLSKLCLIFSHVGLLTPIKSFRKTLHPGVRWSKIQIWG